MKQRQIKMSLIIFLMTFVLIGCTSNSEIEEVKKENARLQEQINKLSKKKDGQAAEKKESTENDNSEKIGKKAITKKDLEDLKVVLKKEQPYYVSSVDSVYEIRIIKQNGNYIVATLNDGNVRPSFPGFQAYLSNDGWKVLFRGQETPRCDEVNALDFPSDIIPLCYDENKNKDVKR